MTNTILRTEKHPDKDEYYDIMMSDEEWQVAHDPLTPNPQIIRDKIVQLVADRTSSEADLNEVRGSKIQAIIQSLGDDLAAFDGATAVQRLAMQKRLILNQLLLTRALMRLGK